MPKHLFALLLAPGFTVTNMLNICPRPGNSMYKIYQHIDRLPGLRGGLCISSNGSSVGVAELKALQEWIGQASCSWTSTTCWHSWASSVSLPTVISPMATGTRQRCNIYIQMHLDTSSRLESWIIQQLAFGSMWLSTWNGDQASKCVWESAVIVARAAWKLHELTGFHLISIIFIHNPYPHHSTSTSTIINVQHQCPTSSTVPVASSSTWVHWVPLGTSLAGRLRSVRSPVVGTASFDAAAPAYARRAGNSPPTAVPALAIHGDGIWHETW